MRQTRAENRRRPTGVQWQLSFARENRRASRLHRAGDGVVPGVVESGEGPDGRFAGGGDFPPSRSQS
jgi:hypothetical protein